MSKVNKLLKDYKLFEEQFSDMCLVKKTKGSELIPSHYVFTFYANVSLVHLRAELNEDNETYRISAQGQILIDSIAPSKIRSKLEKMKIQTGLTGAIGNDYKITSFVR